MDRVEDGVVAFAFLESGDREYDRAPVEIETLSHGGPLRCARSLYGSACASG